jgi:hypothetical protein
VSRGGQKRPEIVQRTKMRRRSFEDPKISLPRVEGATEGVKKGRALDFCLDRFGLTGQKIVELPQPRLLNKPRAPGGVTFHAISSVVAVASQPTRASRASFCHGQLLLRARRKRSLDSMHRGTAEIAGRGRREFLSRLDEGRDFSQVSSSLINPRMGKSVSLADQEGEPSRFATQRVSHDVEEVAAEANATRHSISKQRSIAHTLTCGNV